MHSEENVKIPGDKKRVHRQAYFPGKIPKLWDFLAKIHESSPEVFRMGDLIRQEVVKVWPALKDPERCPNCGEGMHIYAVRFDYHKAVLLRSMAAEVKKKLDAGLTFTEANKIHVVSIAGTDAMRHATSQARTLGLIAKVLTEKGTHDTGSGWLITKRGYAALRNEPVPSEVFVFRNRIIELPDRSPAPPTTIGEVFAKNSPDPYAPEAWYEIADTHTGNLL